MGFPVPPKVTLWRIEQSSPTVAVSPTTIPVAWSMKMPYDFKKMRERERESKKEQEREREGRVRGLHGYNEAVGFL